MPALTEIQVRAAKPREKPYKLNVAGGSFGSSSELAGSPGCLYCLARAAGGRFALDQAHLPKWIKQAARLWGFLALRV